jgi:hypothetical protein
MPRLSTGVYVLPDAVNPVQSGTIIQAAWANTTMDDIALALTDSLDRNGRGGMNVPLNFADGTAPQPGITWTAETSTGLYRAGLGDMRVSILGQDTFRWNQSGSFFWDGAGWVAVGTGGGGSGDLPTGTANYQTLVWNQGTGSWSATSLLTTNYTSNIITVNGSLVATSITEGGTALASKYLGISNAAADSFLLDGQPGSYYLDGSNQTGTVPLATSADNADTVDGWHIVVGPWPGTELADPNTLYFVI